MSERRTTGSRVFAARQGRGLSLRRAARRLGVSPRALRNWERGREDIPFEVRRGMVKLYGIDPEQLIPERRAEAAREGDTAVIRIGSVLFELQSADDDSLRAFLAAVRRERGLAPGAQLAVRASDAEALARLLGGNADDIVANLQRLLGVDQTEAVEIGRWMFRRTAVAGALAVGLVAGVAGAGTVSARPPAAHAAGSTASGGAGLGSGGPGIAEPVPPPADPDWAIIGDAAVLHRDEAPGD